MTREEEVLAFLDERVFNPALAHPRSTPAIKAGVNLTRVRMSQRTAWMMVHYFWSAVIGTDKSKKFAKQMKEIGLNRFEETIDEFRERFGNDWLSQIPPTER